VPIAQIKTIESTSPNACAGPQTDTELFGAAAGPVRNKAELKKFLMSS
jgi:hypothetical protein